MTPEKHIALHKIYEAQALKILIKEFREIGRRISFSALTESNAANVVAIAVNEQKFEKALFKLHLSIGLKAGEIQLQEFEVWNRNKKRRKPSQYPLFSKVFQQYLLDYYNSQGGDQIVTLTETYTQAVINELKKATDEAITADAIAERMRKVVNSPHFYKWQALRIARTETTFAVGAATEVTKEYSLFEVEKVWIHLDRPGQRDSHAAMNGKTVGQKELFEIDGEKLSYPGDRSNGATARNLINCMCRRGYRPKKDANGDWIMNIGGNNTTSLNKYSNLHPEAQKFLKENNIDLDEKFVKYIPKDLPIKYTDGGSQFVFGDGIYINKKNLTTNNRVVYHEIGHAIDINNLNINKSRKLTNALPKAINNDKELIDLHNKLFQLHKNGDDETKNYVNALADTIMGFNPNFGWGHDKKYMKKYGKLEIVAHAFEFKFMGNPIAKQMTPELYDNLIKLIDGYIK